MREKIKAQRGGDGTSGLLLPCRARPHRACRTKRFRALRLKLRFCHPSEAQACAIGRLVGGAGESRLCKGLIPQWNPRSSLQAPPRPLGQSVILHLVVASANLIYSLNPGNGCHLEGFVRKNHCSQRCGRDSSPHFEHTEPQLEARRRNHSRYVSPKAIR